MNETFGLYYTVVYLALGLAVLVLDKYVSFSEKDSAPVVVVGWPLFLFMISMSLIGDALGWLWDRLPERNPKPVIDYDAVPYKFPFSPPKSGLLIRGCAYCGKKPCRCGASQ
jgi:hypothetical protein